MHDEGTIKMFIVAIFLLLAVGSCSRGCLVSEDVAVRALDTQGYSNVEITDHAWLVIGWRGCDEKDAARFTATATNPAGQEVELYVCTGWLFKGATIRTK